MQKMLRKLFFNFWYYQKPPWDSGISPPELMEFIATHPPGRALDLGCGSGTNVITLARHGWQVTGVDFAPRAIALARRKARQAGVDVDLRVEDVTRLKGITPPFDLVLDIGCFHSLSKDEKVIYADNLPRLLTPGGTFLLYAFFKEPGEEGSGLLPEEVDILSKRLRLISRKDGSERGLRKSAWFTYEAALPVP
jgi:SAM-dependent methyltransferase